jgi:hypothetical protein
MQAAGQTLRLLGEARELLGLGQADQARQLIDHVLTQGDVLGEQEVACSCGLLGWLLALRGERVRSLLMAELAVRLAGSCATIQCQAQAYIDQAHALRALGDLQEAAACLRLAHDLTPAGSYSGR